MNMIKILRNLHLNDVLKRHLTFLTFCMKIVSFCPPVGSLINRKEDSSSLSRLSTATKIHRLAHHTRSHIARNRRDERQVDCL